MLPGRLRLALPTAVVLAIVVPAAEGADFRQVVSATPGGTLVVDLDAGSLEIESHDEHQVRVDAHGSGWPGSLELRLEGDGDETRLIGRGRGLFGGFLGGIKLRVRILVPERYGLRVETRGGSIRVEEIDGPVNVRTSGGRIEIDDVDGEVEARTSGGGIEANDIEGDVSLRTSGGPIEASDVYGTVEARTSGGRIELRDVRGPVDAQTSGGSMSVRFTHPPEGTVQTSGGSIEVEFPEDAGLYLESRTSGGRVEVDHDVRVDGRVERNRVEGEINGGGPILRLRTSGGNIRVRAR